MDKRLYRSTTNKIVAGVCGGLGEYFNIDPVFVRVIAVILAIIPHGFGIVAYIVAWIIIPKEREAGAVVEKPVQKQKPLSPWNKYLPGVILIAVGIILLLEDAWYWFHWEDFWPLLLIVAGLFLLLRRSGRREVVDDTARSAGLNNRQPRPENGGTAS
jgi:phage shock protein C